LRASVAATQQLGEEVKRTVRRSNPNHPNRSVFSFDPRCKLCVAGEVHPETGDLGHPKATLIHDCLFCYMPQKADSPDAR
jgi:hypothetical protein